MEQNIVSKTIELIELCKKNPEKKLIGGRVSSQEILVWLQGLDRSALIFQEHSPSVLQTLKKLEQGNFRQEDYYQLISDFQKMNDVTYTLASSCAVLLLALIESDLKAE